MSDLARGGEHGSGVPLKRRRQNALQQKGAVQIMMTKDGKKRGWFFGPKRKYAWGMAAKAETS